MKKLFSTLLIALMAISAMAYDTATEGTEYFGSGIKAIGLADGTVAAYQFYDGDTGAYQNGTITVPATLQVWEDGNMTAEYKVSTVGTSWSPAIFVGSGDNTEWANVTKVVISEGVKKIVMGAFTTWAAMTNLKEVVLPSTLTNIGPGAFQGCEGLTSITCAAATAPTLDDAGWTDQFKGYTEWDCIVTKCKVYVPSDAAKESYNQDPWSYWTAFYSNGKVEVKQQGSTGKLAGGDISLVPAYEAAGDKWLDADNNEITDLVTYLKEKCGWTAVRARLFVNPQQKGNDGSVDHSVCQNLEYVKALGKRVKDAGMKFLLDMHYSDTYVDATHIQAPEAWQGKSASEMAMQVSTYTTETLNALKEAGAEPDYVQVGNEIMYGICGIAVHPYDYAGDNWDGYLGVVKAGCDAVRATLPNAKIIIHTDRANNADYTNYYYNKLVSNSVDFDVIGLSYYPFWHGTLDNLSTNLDTYASNFSGKEIQIVETAYFNCSHAISSKETDMSSIWSFNSEGQAKFIADLINTIKGKDAVTGMYYWQPEECGNGSDGETNRVLDTWQNRGFWEQSWMTGSHRLTAETALQNIKYLSVTDDPATPTFMTFTNGDFETNDMTGWNIDDWAMLGSNSNQYWPRAYDSSHWEKIFGGNYYFSMWGDGVNGKEGFIAYQTATAPKKGLYTLTADFYAEAANLSLCISNGTSSKKTYIPVSNAGNYSVTILAEEGATLKAGIYTDVPTGSVYAYCDNFTLSYIESDGGAGPQTQAVPGEVYSNTEITAIGLEDGTVAITKLLSVKDGKVTVPTVLDKFEGATQTLHLTVSAVGNGACVVDAPAELTEVTLPAEITVLGDNAFYDCNALEVINVNATTAPTLGKNVFGSSVAYDAIPKNAIIYVPEGTAQSYKSDDLNYWSLFYANHNIRERGTISITQVGYATYYNDYGYTLPEGLSAYIVYNISEGTAAMMREYVGGEEICAGNALILKGNKGDYDIILMASGGATEDQRNKSRNALKGTQTEQMIEAQAGYVYYQFSNDDTDGLGWYWGADGGAAFVNGAHKAYLPVAKGQSQGRMIRFDLNPTEINSIDAFKETAVKKGIKYVDSKGRLVIDGKYLIDGRAVK